MATWRPLRLSFAIRSQGLNVRGDGGIAGGSLCHSPLDRLFPKPLLGKPQHMWVDIEIAAREYSVTYVISDMEQSWQLIKFDQGFATVERA